MLTKGEPHDDDENQPPSDLYLKNRYKLQFLPPTEQRKDVETVTIDEARKIIADAISDYIDTDYHGKKTMLVIAAGTGVGKTTTSLRALNSYSHRAIFCMPNKKHFSILSENKEFEPHRWHQWVSLGDDSLIDPESKMCREWLTTNLVLKAHLSLSVACSICPIFRGDCEYHLQKLTPKPFIATSHNYLTTPFGLQGEEPKLVFVDEDPTSVFVSEIHVQTRDFPHNGDKRIIDFIKELSFCCTAGKTLSGRDLMDRLRPYADGWVQAVTEGHLPKTTPPNNQTEARSLKPDIWMEFNDVFMKELAAYDVGSDRYAERIICGETKKDGHHVTIIHRNYISERIDNCKFVILDGTADLAHYKNLFPDREIFFVKPQVKQLGKLIQVVGNQFGITELSEPKNKTEYNQHLEKLLRTVQTIGRTYKYQRIGIVTYKDLVSKFEALFGVDNVLYYGGDAAGSNKLVDCDGVFVVGTYQPPSNAIARLHYAICQNDMRHLTTETVDGKLLPQFTRKLMPYNFFDADGNQAHRIVGGFWDEPLATAYRHETIRHAEQAIGRARLNTQAHNNVWFLSSLPTSLRIDEIYDTAPIYPQGIDRDRWAKIQEKLSAFKDFEFITVSQLAEWAGVSPRYASSEKWVEKIAAHFGAIVATAPVTTIRQKCFLYEPV